LPGEAEYITLDHEWEATIPLDESHNVHPAIAKINDAEEWVRA